MSIQPSEQPPPSTVTNGESTYVDRSSPHEFFLLDGATPCEPVLSPGSRDAVARIVSTREVSLHDRLEAFEDLIASEVGDTTLTRARNIEREVDLRQIYLKFEGSNPTGTQKDRIAFAQALDALRRGYDTITVATCGNYGAAIAFAASFAGLRCLIFIPESYKTRRTREMEDRGAEIVRVPGDYENAVMESCQYARDHDIYDANPGGANVAIQLRAYGEIAYEIYDDLRDAPGSVSVPVSNGTCLAGIWKGFQNLYRRGRTSRLPRMIAGSSLRKNPIIQAYVRGFSTCEDLKPEDIRETPINEPLINWHAIDGDLALAAVRESGGFADDASDKLLAQWARKVREVEGLSVLPASTAGLIALIEGHRKNSLPGDRHVVVLTGRKA